MSQPKYLKDVLNAGLAVVAIGGSYTTEQQYFSLVRAMRVQHDELPAEYLPVSAGSKSSEVHAQDLRGKEGENDSTPMQSITYADDEEVRRASAKVFRLHARLFEALAK